MDPSYLALFSSLASFLFFLLSFLSFFLRGLGFPPLSLPLFAPLILPLTRPAPTYHGEGVPKSLIRSFICYFTTFSAWWIK